MDIEMSEVFEADSELTSPPPSLMDLDFKVPLISNESSPNLINAGYRKSTPILSVKPGIKALFERLPFELIEKIAVDLERDSDLSNLALTSSSFAVALLPSRSGIWRERFLARYDHPIISHPNEFRIAYQIRRLATKAFVEFEDGGGEQGLECLETLKDMVIETYNARGPSSTAPIQSKNLNLFAQPAHYIDKFLMQPLYALQRSKYGQPHDYFDALQLCLSHLMLAPQSYTAIKSSSRDNFDAQRVYKFDQKFETLYHSRNRQLQEHKPIDNPVLCLNLHDLLHIRNFWNRHLTSFDENTYVQMIQKLHRDGRGPQRWTSALKPFSNEVTLPSTWIGHYSCMHPYPKKMSDIQDGIQTCAEDWGSIKPLTLDIANSHSQASWFPEIFANIPALKHTLPDLSPLHQKPSKLAASGRTIRFLRGVAPFIKPLSPGRDSSTKANFRIKDHTIENYLGEAQLLPGLEKEDLSNPNVAPYQGLRMRGITYAVDVKNVSDTPYNDSVTQLVGLFTRIVFVLYKPTDFYLLATAEHWKYVQDKKALLKYGVIPSAPNPVPNHTSSSVNTSHGNLNSNPDQSGVNAISSGQNSAASRSKKPKKSKKKSEEYGPLPDKSLVLKQEDAYHSSTETPLKWDDIDYAYAYEGSILPGGKIQLGRWWRCDPWIVRESGLPVPLELFDPAEADEGDEDGDGEEWLADTVVQQSLSGGGGGTLPNTSPPSAAHSSGTDHPNTGASPPTEALAMTDSSTDQIMSDTPAAIEPTQEPPSETPIPTPAPVAAPIVAEPFPDNTNPNNSTYDASPTQETNVNVNTDTHAPAHAQTHDARLKQIWDDDAVPWGERGPFVFWVDGKGE